MINMNGDVPKATNILKPEERVDKISLGKYLRARLRRFKFAPGKFVEPAGYKDVILLLDDLYFLIASLIHSGSRPHLFAITKTATWAVFVMAERAGLQNTSLCFALRARLRRFKFAPGKFVEPAGDKENIFVLKVRTSLTFHRSARDLALTSAIKKTATWAVLFMAEREGLQNTSLCFALRARLRRFKFVEPAGG